MKEGNYLINIRVLEASDLIPPDSNSFVSPFCVVYVMDQHQHTKTAKKTLSPLWDQSFAFELKDLTKGQLESATITFEVYDKQYYVFSKLIGKYEIDLSTIYYQKYHQYYMTWFTLVDTTDEKEGLTGYIKCNIDVLGPDDKPHVNEKITEDSTSQTVVSSKIRQQGHLIIAELFRSEHIAPMNMTKKSIDGYVKINYGGATISSKVVDSANPVWNQILYLQAMLPNHSKNIQIELWNSNSVMRDDLIGTCLIPFNSFNSLMELPPMWVNIYGPPLCGIGEKSQEMALHGFRRGSCYRGRVLMRFSSKYHDNPKSRAIDMAYKAPEMIIPTPPTKAYFLRIEVYTGQELPGRQGMLHFCIGPYFKKTKIVSNNRGIFDWGMENVEFNRVLLPIDIWQIPDLIVYFADEDFESHRKCFWRIKPPKILNRLRKRYEKDFQTPSLIRFREDPTLDLVPDDQFSGFVILRPVLFAYEPPERIKPESLSAQKFNYNLRLFFYVGRNLPTATDGGTCNPVVVIRVANQMSHSTIKINTVNPEWYEVRDLSIQTYDHNNKDAPPLAIVVMLYHVDNPAASPEELFDENKVDEQKGDLTSMLNLNTIKKELIQEKKILLGRYWMDVDLSKQKLYKDPAGGKEQTCLIEA